MITVCILQPRRYSQFYVSTEAAANKFVSWLSTQQPDDEDWILTVEGEEEREPS